MQHHEFKEKKNKSLIKIKSTMDVWKTCYIEMRGYNLQVKENEKKGINNDLEPW